MSEREARRRGAAFRRRLRWALWRGGRALRDGPLSGLRARLLLAALAVALVILPTASLVLVSLYREAAMALLDDSLGKEVDALIVRPALQRYLARLPDGPVPVVATPELEPAGGVRDNLLAVQRHWQVVRLASAAAERNIGRNMPPRAVLVSASLAGKALPLPSRRGVVLRPDMAAYTDLQKSPIIEAGGAPPVLRLLERQVALEQHGRTVLYAFVVARDISPIEDNIARFQVRLMGIFALLALAMALAMVLVVWFGLAPLGRLRRALVAIREGRARRLSGRFPREIAPLQHDLNRLLRSRQEIIERARTHVGNLAHALKTPLSVLLNEARGTDGALAEKVREQAEIMQRQIAHHLDRARIAAQVDVIGEASEVCPVLERLVRALRKIYVDKSLAITLHCPPGLRFRGEQQDLEEMAGNLLDNACKWAVAQVRLVVTFVPQESAARGGTPRHLVVTVEDDGPGLSDEEKQQVVARGRRLDTQVPGSGLGLAIVSDLARLYEGRLRLEDSPLGGLRAQLHLPAA